MDIAVVGTPEFTLGFQLAGVTRLHNPADLEETANVLRSLMDTPEVGIVVIDSSDLTQMPEKLRFQLSQRASHPPYWVLGQRRITPFASPLSQL